MYAFCVAATLQFSMAIDIDWFKSSPKKGLIDPCLCYGNHNQMVSGAIQPDVLGP
ncbi:unnamed protein product [Acidithrix sp. C25]|nr:unnamed protein product [Acidithrix sp. C25]